MRMGGRRVANKEKNRKTVGAGPGQGRTVSGGGGVRWMGPVLAIIFPTTLSVVCCIGFLLQRDDGLTGGLAWLGVGWGGIDEECHRVCVVCMRCMLCLCVCGLYPLVEAAAN